MPSDRDLHRQAGKASRRGPRTGMRIGVLEALASRSGSWGHFLAATTRRRARVGSGPDLPRLRSQKDIRVLPCQGLVMPGSGPFRQCYGQKPRR